MTKIVKHSKIIIMKIVRKLSNTSLGSEIVLNTFLYSLQTEEKEKSRLQYSFLKFFKIIEFI